MRNYRDTYKTLIIFIISDLRTYFHDTIWNSNGKYRLVRLKN